MFSDCNSLRSLPDISNWDISEVTYIEFMFNKCKSLISIPDLSKWNTSNVTNIRAMLQQCNLLISIPDLSKWNTIFDLTEIFFKLLMKYSGCMFVPGNLYIPLPQKLLIWAFFCLVVFH